MASLKVKYKYADFNIKTTLSLSVNDILIKALAHFKLNGDARTWRLMYGDKELSSDMTYRQLNLVNGSTLKLVRSLNKKNNDGEKFITVKFQAMGIGANISKVQVNADVGATITRICKEENWNIEPENKSSIFLFSKSFSLEELHGVSFTSIGITEDVLLRIRVPHLKATHNSKKRLNVFSKNISASNEAGRGSSTPDIDLKSHSDKPNKHNATKSPGTNETTQISKDKELYNPVVYVPSSGTRDVPEDSDSREDYELSEADVLKYQNMLSHRAMNAQFKKKIIQDESDNKNEKTIEQFNIRVRLPDMKLLDISFSGQDLMSDVYALIRRVLANSDIEFTLFHSYPYKKLDNSPIKLSSLGFGINTLLLLETSHPGPYLMQSLLGNAKTDQYKDPIKFTSNTSKNHSAPHLSTKNKKMLKKIPKWIKLSKK